MNYDLRTQQVPLFTKMQNNVMCNYCENLLKVITPAHSFSCFREMDVKIQC